MAYFIDLKTFSDNRGNLTVMDNVLPFEIKRVYYIYNATQKRGGHRHHKTIQAIICLAGSCRIFVNDNVSKNTYILDKPDKCLVIEPKDWHTMDNFSINALLLVVSSEHYDVKDYIDEEYK